MTTYHSTTNVSSKLQFSLATVHVRLLHLKRFAIYGPYEMINDCDNHSDKYYCYPATNLLVL